MRQTNKHSTGSGFFGASFAGHAIVTTTIVLISLATASRAYADKHPDISRSNYEAAVRLLLPNLKGLVRNESVRPHWIGDSGRFWYQREGEDGPEFVVVDATGTKSPAFNHSELARSLSKASGEKQPRINLPAALTDVLLSDNLSRLSGTIGGRSYSCDLNALHCWPVEHNSVPLGGLLSPDGRWAAFTRNHNLFVRNVMSGEERALTTDGSPLYAWAWQPDLDSYSVLKRLRSHRPRPLYEIYWAPDSRHLIAPRVDERQVGVIPYVEWVPIDGSRRPLTKEVRRQFPGDRGTLRLDYFLFDVQTGERMPIQLPGAYASNDSRGDLVLGWSRSRNQVFLLSCTYGSKSVAVFRLKMATGELTTILEETANTRVELNAGSTGTLPNARLINDGSELVWYSERSGWGHLYLYDAQSGRLKRSITRGDWRVQDIQVIDEARREIYFTGLGREPGRDVYYSHLYRASLDGNGDATLLTPPNAHHLFYGAPSSFSKRYYGDHLPSILIRPDLGVFIDTWSTVDQPPISVLRSTRDGRVIAQLERADASRLFSAGWKAPVRERVKAADGKTDLYAVYWAPHTRMAGAKYPLIDAAYGGAPSVQGPIGFAEAYDIAGLFGDAALTHLGFGVLRVDGRGTAARSRAFHDDGYPEYIQVGIDDHIAAIRDLATRHPEIDLERVGVYGVSWGGNFAAQAILSRPTFYKVAVSSAGAYDYAAMYSGYEPYNGVPRYPDGTYYRSRADETPKDWRRFDVTAMAGRLQGHLLITYGDSDENVPPHQAARLIDALTRAGKPYDLIYVPNGDHDHFFTSYVMKRSWDYFVEHLQGVEPVRDFDIGLPKWLNSE